MDGDVGFGYLMTRQPGLKAKPKLFSDNQILYLHVQQTFFPIRQREREREKRLFCQSRRSFSHQKNCERLSFVCSCLVLNIITIITIGISSVVAIDF